MENYKPNSHAYKERMKKEAEEGEPNKKVEKVIRGNVKTKRKNGFLKFADVFISEDVNNVKTYIVSDVLIPAAKKAVSDVVRNGIDMLLYGSSGSNKRDSNASRVSYRSFYDRRDDGPRMVSDSRRPAYNYDDIIFDNRGEAEDVLSRMFELIDTYQMVSVADLYDLVGLTGNYTDNKYGWINLSTAEVVRVRDGYMIKLPKARPFD